MPSMEGGLEVESSKPRLMTNSSLLLENCRDNIKSLRIADYSIFSVKLTSYGSSSFVDMVFEMVIV